MQLLSRNLKSIWFCEYLGLEPEFNLKGQRTGDSPKYSEPVMKKMNVSAARGRASQEQFGLDIKYDKVMLTADMSCPIQETSILFIERAPTFDREGTPLNDYIITRVSKSLNHIAYAISKVEQS